MFNHYNTPFLDHIVPRAEGGGKSVGRVYGKRPVGELSPSGRSGGGARGGYPGPEAGKNPGGAGAIMLAATVMGFAGVVQMTPAFDKLVEWCLNINLNPYLTESISINLLAGVTGSAAAGIQIFMQTFADSFLSMGMNAAVMHRLAPIASFGLNTLPHNATVVLSLKYMNVTYKESYGYVIITTIILPTLSSILTTLIAIAFFR